MNKNLKKSLMLCSLVVVGFGLSLALAQVDIKSDLSNAIQNIQKVYFSPEGIKDPDQNKNILVELEQGALRIHGKVIIENLDAAGNTIAAQASGSAIIQGKENKIFGGNSILLGGKNNQVASNAQQALGVGGFSNTTYGGAQGGVLFGGRENKIKTGSNSAIAAGRENEVEGTNSFVAGGNLVTIKGDQSFAAGKNIKANPTSAKNAVFLWSDSSTDWIALGQQVLTPEKDDTFLIRSANGLAIGKNVPEVKGVDVQGLVQIGDQAITCNPHTNGAIKYIGDQRGCFCSCNGQTWLSMSQSRNCMNRCR